MDDFLLWLGAIGGPFGIAGFIWLLVAHFRSRPKLNLSVEFVSKQDADVVLRVSNLGKLPVHVVQGGFVLQNGSRERMPHPEFNPHWIYVGVDRVHRFRVEDVRGFAGGLREQGRGDIAHIYVLDERNRLFQCPVPVGVMREFHGTSGANPS